MKGERPIRNHVDDEKAHALCFYHQIPERACAILPKKCFAPTEEQNANAHVIELLHFLPNLFIGMDDCCDIVDGAVLAMQIAFIGYDDRSENCRFLFKQNCLYAKGSKVKKG